MNKKKYVKPKLSIQKIRTFFFACKTNANQCTTVANKKSAAAGCPT